MINLTKSYDFFKPEQDQRRIHILGCGSVGSTIAENLVRCGKTKITLYDFDIVEAKNVHNQMFFDDDIGKPKVEALKELLLRINPSAEPDIKIESEGWNGEMLSGYVFLCVDNIEIRKAFVEQHKNNYNIKAVFDIRTLLTGAQLYAANWADIKMKENLIASMDFSHEEAQEEAPKEEMSACGEVLGIVTTVRLISALATNNYIKYCKGEQIWKFVQIDGFSGILDCF